MELDGCYETFVGIELCYVMKYVKCRYCSPVCLETHKGFEDDDISIHEKCKMVSAFSSFPNLIDECLIPAILNKA